MDKEEMVELAEPVESEELVEPEDSDESTELLKPRKKKCREPMKHPFLAGVVTTLICLMLVFSLVWFIPVFHPKKPNSLATYKKINVVQWIIDHHFMGEVDRQKEADYIFLGMMAALEERYSTYYSKEEYEAISRAQDGMYLGIGVTIMDSETDDYLVVQGVIADSPAEKAGILEGDVILTINGTSTTELTISEAAQMIQTAEDDTIHLELLRDGTEEPLVLDVKREKIENTFVYGGMIGDNIGYIQITQFTGVVPAQFKAMFEQLQGMGMDRLIIDLRSNPGGLVDAVCDTLRQFLPKGLIVYTEDKNGKREEETCKGETPIEIPLVVLVNGNSASASEIFAGAVQDHGIGKIVGTTTYGKGIVQSTYELSDGSAVKLTVSHYYTPNGNDIHGVGITPDVEVEQPEDAKSDVQLAKAVEVISE